MKNFVLMTFFILFSYEAFAQGKCATAGVFATGGHEYLTVGDEKGKLNAYSFQTAVNGPCTEALGGVFEVGLQIDFENAVGNLNGHRATANQFAAGPKFCLRAPTDTALCASVGATYMNLHLYDVSYRLGAPQRELSLEQRVFDQFAITASSHLEAYQTGGRSRQAVTNSSYLIGLGWSPHL